jgi:hypothetical protein
MVGLPRGRESSRFSGGNGSNPVAYCARCSINTLNGLSYLADMHRFNYSVS